MGKSESKRFYTGDQWANRDEIRFTVKVQDTDVIKWMKTSGDLLFCEPWGREKVPHGVIPVATTDPAEIIAIAKQSMGEGF